MPTSNSPLLSANNGVIKVMYGLFALRPKSNGKPTFDSIQSRNGGGYFQLVDMDAVEDVARRIRETHPTLGQLVVVDSKSNIVGVEMNGMSQSEIVWFR